MQYDNYERKIEKIASAIRFVLRNMVKIVIAASAVMACVTALLVTRGIITDDGTCPESIIYGEKIDLGAKAFLAKTSYEYASADGDNWSETVPNLPGTYRVRAVSRGTFGYERYSEPHTFELLPRPITVTPESFTYGEKPKLSVSGLVRGDTLGAYEFTYEEIFDTYATLTPISGSIVINNKKGEDVTACYDITARTETVAIRKRDITVSVHSKTAEYNGKPLTSDAYELTAGTLAEGDVITLEFDRAITDVGEILNTPTVSIVDKDGNDVLIFYNVTESVGTLKVTPRPLHITTGDGEWVYNDEEYFNEEYTFTDGTSPIDEHLQWLTVIMRTEITNVGSVPNELGIKILVEGVRDVTDNYDLVLTYGTLTVTPKHITISTASDTKMYDGTPLFNKQFSVEGAVEGHVFAVTSYAQITNASSVENTLGFSVKNASGKAVNIIDNYEITYEYGTLEVTRRPLEIYTKDQQWVYDSTPHSYTDYEALGLLDGHTLTPDTVTEITFVGTAENVNTYKVIANGEDLTANYEITYPAFGTLEVTKADLYMTTFSKEWTYDGQVHSYPGYDWYSGLGKNDMIVVDESTVPTITNVGECSNVFTVTVRNKQTGEDVSDNYNISYKSYGTLTVIKRTVTVETESAEKQYDGTPLTNDNYSVMGLVDGHTISVEVIGSVTLPNEAPGVDNAVDESLTRIFDENGNDVTDNYNITYKYGKLLVTRFTMVLTTPDIKAEYDGKEHYSTDYTLDTNEFEKGGRFENYSIAVESYTTYKDVNSDTEMLRENRISVSIKDPNGDDVSEYFKITYEYGFITVTPKPITVTTSGGEWVYDGKEHYNTDYTLDGLINGHTHGYESYTKLRDVVYELEPMPDIDIIYPEVELYTDIPPAYILALGRYNKIKVKIYDEEETDVTRNYEITYVYGVLTVTPLDITVTTGSFEKVYDGTDTKYDGDYTLSREPVEGDYFEIAIYGAGHINVGTYQNIIALKFFHNEEKLKDEDKREPCNHNYNVTYEYGTVTVTPREITVKPYGEKTYDGAKFTDFSVIPTETSKYGLAAGDKATATLKSFPVFAGTYTECEIIANGVRIVNERGTDVTKNYVIKTEKGTLTINKLKVTLISASDEKRYDGTPLTNGDYEFANNSALVYGHVISIKITGIQTEVGQSPNTILKDSVKVYEGKTDVTANYEFTFEEGTLKVVIAADITVITESKSKIYDGTPLVHNVSSYLVTSGALAEGHYVDIVVTGSITEPGTVINTATYVIRDKKGNDVSGGYNLSEKFGTLEVIGINVDTDADGEPDLNLDTDGDGKPDVNIDTDGDKKPDLNIDLNGDTIPDLNVDTDGDGVPDNGIDTDGDGKPDLNLDTDGDGKPDVNVDTDSDGKPDINIDTDGDLLPDLNADTDGDGRADVNIDTDGDGLPDKNIDSDGDGIPDDDSPTDNGNVNVDTDGDGEPDYNLDTDNDGRADTNIDTNGDGKPDVNIDTDGDGEPDYNLDTDGDGRADMNIDTDGDGDPDLNLDADGNGQPDTNLDADGDGVPDDILNVPPKLNVDTDGDGEPDLNVDTDGDGRADTNIDTDKDGEPDVNIDTDGDGEPEINIDTNGDGKADLNIDTDADGEPEVNVDTNGDGRADTNIDTNGDGKPNLNIDTDGDGKPNVNLDTNGDGRADTNIDINGDGEPEFNVDTNGDGKPDLDIDTDGDILPDLNVDTNNDGRADMNIDTNGDGYPDNNVDTDGDGKPDLNFDTNKDGNPDVNIDTNGDGKPDLNVDTNGDGKPDVNLDTNGDGKADTNIDSDGDGIADTNTGKPGGSSGQLGSGGTIESPDLSDAVCYWVRSDKTGQIYLRFKSFGDYNGRGFDEASVYTEYVNSKYSAIYLTSIALASKGYAPYNVTVIPENGQFVLPYYSATNPLETGNDVLVSGNGGAEYTLTYYVMNSSAGLEMPAELAMYEQQYREFVYANYLDIDGETLEYMSQIIASQGFRNTDPNIIEDVATYIRDAADYNLDYDRRLDKSANIVISFLRDYGEGICQHYAASAVMLYRALGIPARYTVGFVADAVAGELVEVTGGNAHAWVEIYVDGVGWVMVEVTGASSNPSIEPPTWGETPEKKETLVVTPTYRYKEYDGMPLYADSVTYNMPLQELMYSGYSCSWSVSGSITLPGKATSYVNYFRLYDPFGNDVTDNYDIVFEEGVLEVSEGIIEIFLYEIQKYYDGTPLVYGENDYEIISELDEGVTVDISINISLTECGWLKNSDINSNRDEYISYKVYKDGVDVSDNYMIVLGVYDDMHADSYIPIRVDRRSIEITSATASKPYDGKELRDQDIYITQGSLANGDTLYGFASGSITDVGSAINYIHDYNVRILNKDNEDVTDNYSISISEGQLIVYML